MRILFEIIALLMHPCPREHYPGDRDVCAMTAEERQQWADITDLQGCRIFNCGNDANVVVCGAP